MPFDSFTSHFGTYQGRLRPAGFTPVGEVAFVLGSDVPGIMALLEIGDFVEVSQTGDLTGVKYLRFTMRGRPPTSLPPGAAWQLSLWVAGLRRATTLILPGRTRDHADLAANVSHLPGNQAVALRLEVVAA